MAVSDNASAWGEMMATTRNDPQELYGVQILRGVAALAVVTHHSLVQSSHAQGRFSPDWITISGASGVDIFFVISGFIMLFVSFRPQQEPIRPTTFLFRRFTRIYPFYWMCCLCILSVLAVGLMSHRDLTTSEIVASLALAPSDQYLIIVSWTLVYEVYFYAIFSLSLLFKSKAVSVIATTMVIAAMTVVGRVLPFEPVRAFLSNPVALEFCMGLWIAWAFSLSRERSASPMRALDNRPIIRLALSIVGFGLLAAAPLFVTHTDGNGLQGLPRVFAWGVPAALIVFTFLNIKAPTNRIMRAAVLLGDASYALYLTHEFIMIGYARSLKIGAISRIDQYYVVPILILVCVGVGLAAHLFVEKPLLAFTRRLTRRRVSPPEESPAAA